MISVANSTVAAGGMSTTAGPAAEMEVHGRASPSRQHSRTTDVTWYGPVPAFRSCILNVPARPAGFHSAGMKMECRNWTGFTSSYSRKCSGLTGSSNVAFSVLVYSHLYWSMGSAAAAAGRSDRPRLRSPSNASKSLERSEHVSPAAANASVGFLAAGWESWSDAESADVLVQSPTVLLQATHASKALFVMLMRFAPGPMREAGTTVLSAARSESRRTLPSSKIRLGISSPSAATLKPGARGGPSPAGPRVVRSSQSMARGPLPGPAAGASIRSPAA